MIIMRKMRIIKTKSTVLDNESVITEVKKRGGTAERDDHESRYAGEN